RLQLLEFLQEFHPENWRIAQRRAEIHEKAGQKEKAAAAYETALKYCDDLWKIGDLREALKALKPEK
ncbi:MAG: hypothetical protein AAF570_22950, partial [Bacteroidota bacterium]